MGVEAKSKYPHIVFDEKGAPMIQGTTLKVIELVVEKLAYGWSPEELYFQHPYLTLGQIHATLAYYWDHADDLGACPRIGRLSKKYSDSIEEYIDPKKLSQRNYDDNQT